MHKVADQPVEPTTIPPMTAEEQVYYDERTRQGLADVAAGRTLTIEQAKANMKAHIAKRKQAI